MEFQLELDALEARITEKFSKIAKNKNIVFIKKKDLADLNSLSDNTIFEIRDCNTGYVYDAYIVSINNEIFKVIELEYGLIKECRFEHFSCTEFRIDILRNILSKTKQ